MPPNQPGAISKVHLSVSGWSNPLMIRNLSSSERARNGVSVAHSCVVRELQAFPARGRERGGGPAGRVGDVNRYSVAARLVGDTQAVQLGADVVHAEMEVSFRGNILKEGGASGSYQRWQALTVTGILASGLVGELERVGWSVVLWGLKRVVDALLMCCCCDDGAKEKRTV